MDLSKLSANEKLAVYGAAAAVVGGIVAALTWRTYGGAWIAVLAGLAMLAIVLLPQQRPGTSLPGSKGTLMLIAGGIAGVLLLLLFLTTVGFTFVDFGVADILWIVAVVGSVVMAWAGWQEFQAEGGTFQLGTAGGGAAPPAADDRSGAPVTSEPSVASSQPAAPSEPAASSEPAPAPDQPTRSTQSTPTSSPPADEPPTHTDERPPA